MLMICLRQTLKCFVCVCVCVLRISTHTELDQQIQSGFFYNHPCGIKICVKDTVVFLKIPEEGC